MLAVTLSEKELLPLLTGDLTISLINGPALCVVAGPAAAVAEFERRLKEKQIISRRVPKAPAFYSRMLSPGGRSFDKEGRKASRAEAVIPFDLKITGRWVP